MPTDSTTSLDKAQSESLLSDAVALTVSTTRAIALTSDGEVRELSKSEAEHVLKLRSVIVCHHILTARRLELPPQPHRRDLYDILELFAFVRPAAFCVPTPAGVAAALDLPSPNGLEGAAETLLTATNVLIGELLQLDQTEAREARAASLEMQSGGWSWAPHVLAALSVDMSPDELSQGAEHHALTDLSEWEDLAPPGASGSEPVTREETDRRLALLLEGGNKTHLTEQRDQQVDYARAVSKVLAPRPRAGEPQIVLAEAGTGIGKTLAYLAPASVWAEKNGPGLWISTYTKNLQRQIDQELDRLYPNQAVKAKRAVVRKGRENYLCLLNLQEQAGSLDAISLGLITRWARASRDGDMIGGDFPAWLGSLLSSTRGLALPAVDRPSLSTGLTDRRGECIYSVCPYYRKCFIEKAVRKSRHADLVVANHALVMVQAALEQASERPHVEPTDSISEPKKLPARPHPGPTRFIFDEGHHLFEAADSAFSTHLTGLKTAELRRWIRGPEERSQRGRSLQDRIGDLTDDNPDAAAALREVRRAAQILPGSGWASRLVTGQHIGPTEDFLALVYSQVLARSKDMSSTSYDQETSPWPVIEGLLERAQLLEDALGEIAEPFEKLARLLRDLLHDQTGDLDAQTKGRIDAVARGLERWTQLQLPAWRAMLRCLADGTEDAFVDWFSLHRAFGRLFDLGMHRHWVDPTIPFADAVIEPAHGVLITSATLRDYVPEHLCFDDLEPPPTDWQSAEVRTGAIHLALPATRHNFASPFDYATQTEIIIVNDVPRNDSRAVAAAYRKLFIASRGGALGLFTAIKRLRHVYESIVYDLESSGLQLFAQHIDPIDTGTLVDMFRSEEDSCLLGTDAVRDGIDVPGGALRLIVFDRVPWPRPDILHKARKKYFGGNQYDDLITRFRLKQAYGRLIRRNDDRGIFIMLDARTPTRLTATFPEEAEVQRLNLNEAVARVQNFFSEHSCLKS